MPQSPTHEKVSFSSSYGNEVDYYLEMDDYDDDYYDDDSEYDEYVPKGKNYHQVSKLGGRMSSSLYREQVVTDYAAVIDSVDKQHKTRSPVKQKNDRKTVEGLDGLSKKLLNSLEKRDVIQDMGGIISQGKEATIYRCQGLVEEVFHDMAAKVFKTTKIEFKNRELYIIGDNRFKYNIKNDNVEIRLWAEKEFRNLKRLHRAGILCPEPLVLKKHIVLMSYIGDKNNPGIPLSKFEMDSVQAISFYWDLTKIVRSIFHDCNMVHADLGTFNILVYDNDLYIIDLAQAVLTEHPFSMDFLKRDCYNLTRFFYNQHQLQNIMTTKEFFDFVTDPSIIDIDVFIDSKKEEIASRLLESVDLVKDMSLEDSIWFNNHVPRSLKDIDDPFTSGVFSHHSNID
eukprot:TRINITY_DN2695_c0_g1_i1.p1 TRINITY_DN2695_c0_g1~~TRINITY_DN2695_c0_g1_i1.p1  ORF type:complete len:397 (+),score=82.25 TRINITY_DN2695_c0_g1_i1:366-1556(+)